MNKFADLQQAFSIFGKYDTGEYNTRAKDGVIWAGPHVSKVSEFDKVTLAELGWHPAAEGGFYTNL